MVEVKLQVFTLVIAIIALSNITNENMGHKYLKLNFHHSLMASIVYFINSKLYLNYKLL
jgi:hypothetical protein